VSADQEVQVSDGEIAKEKSAAAQLEKKKARGQGPLRANRHDGIGQLEKLEGGKNEWPMPDTKDLQVLHLPKSDGYLEKRRNATLTTAKKRRRRPVDQSKKREIEMKKGDKIPQISGF